MNIQLLKIVYHLENKHKMWYNVNDMEGSMSFTWMIVFLILMFIELATVNLVSIWFAIGALVAFIISYFVDILYI